MHRAMKALAQSMAILGGIVLVALIVLTTTSILGRVVNDLLYTEIAQSLPGGLADRLLALGVGEVRGSYELLEAGIAFAIFSFFPICQLHAAHATVDIFTARLPERVSRWLIAFWEVVLTAALLLVTVQLFGGVQRYYGNGETTLFLQFPLWWAYAASFAAACVTSVVAVYCAAIRVGEAVTGNVILPRA